MKIVILKNGQKFKVDDSVADTLASGLEKKGTVVILVEIKTDGESGSTVLVVNLKEVAAIISPENII